MGKTYIFKKYFLLFLWVPCFFIAAFVIKLFVIDKNKKRYYLSKNFTNFSKLFLRICNIKLSKIDIEIPEDKGVLIVANHMSYVEIFCIAAAIPVVFVSTVEIYERPFLGLFPKFNGSIFIERRSIRNINKELLEITDLLSKNFKVIFFPEGDTTDGTNILPFKSPFFNAAIDAKVDVVALCLKYLSVDGEAFNEKNKDVICYYGDMYFKNQIRKLLKTKRIEASLKQVGCIAYKEGLIREDIAEYTFDKISNEYKKEYMI